MAAKIVLFDTEVVLKNFLSQPIQNICLRLAPTFPADLADLSTTDSAEMIKI